MYFKIFLFFQVWAGLIVKNKSEKGRKGNGPGTSRSKTVSFYMIIPCFILQDKILLGTR